MRVIRLEFGLRCRICELVCLCYNLQERIMVQRSISDGVEFGVYVEVLECWMWAHVMGCGK